MTMPGPGRVQTFSFITNQGKGASEIIPNSKDYSGFTFVLEVDDTSQFSSPQQLGSVSYVNGDFHISFSAAEVDSVKDAYYRIVATRVSDSFTRTAVQGD